jgi:tetratricopeptide (TPR) repeat protein
MKIISFDEHPERLKKKKLKEAEKLLDKANTFFYIDKDYAESGRLYELAIDSFSEFDKAQVFVYENLSESYFMQNKLKETVSVLEKCLENHPDDKGVMVKLGMLHINQFEEIRNPMKAVHYFKYIKSIDPYFKFGCLSIDTMLMWAEIYSDMNN